MTAWLPTAIAVRQTLSDFLLIVTTIGWTQPGWTEALRAFPGTGREDGALAVPVPREQGGAIAVPSPSEPRIQLFPAAIETNPAKEKSSMSSGYSMLPSFNISDHTKADVIWLARDAGVPVDRALQTLVEIYQLQRSNENDFWDLETILHLRQACDATEVTVSELREVLSLLAGLQERGLTLDHIRTTLKVAEDLSAAGLYLDEAVGVANMMEAMEEAGIDPSVPAQLQTALARFEALGYTPERIAHLAELWERVDSLGASSLDDLAELVAQMHHLRTLGLDTPGAEGLVTAMELAGIPEPQRAGMLAEAVEKGVVHISLPALHAERDALRQDIQQLQDEHAQPQDAVAAARGELMRVQQEEDAARERVGSLQESGRQLEDAIFAAQALEAFLLNLDPGDRIFVNVARIAEIRQKHPGRLQALEQILAESVRKGIREFLARISTMPNQPPPTMPSAADAPTHG
jgi:phage shock protein A